MVTTFEKKEKNQLLKKFHALLGQTCNSIAVKEGILAQHGVESSRDLTAAELFDICLKLAIDLNPELAKLNGLRKRAISAISTYFQKDKHALFEKDYDKCTESEQKQRSEYAKRVAERSTQIKNFNDIPVSRLENIIHGFNKKTADLERIEILKTVEFAMWGNRKN